MPWPPNTEPGASTPVSWIRRTHARSKVRVGTSLVLASMSLVIASAAAIDVGVAGAAEEGQEIERQHLAEPGVRPEEGQVERLYRAILGRPSEPGGFEFWVVRRLEGWSLDRLADEFIASPEFRSRFGAPSDTGFVDQLYRNVLDRTPDAGGRAFWLDQLGSGVSRARVVLLFSESPEFVELSGTVPPAYADDRPDFTVALSSVSEADLGASWRPGCPVGPEDLVHLDLRHLDRAGVIATGRLTVHRDVVDDVTTIFAELYRRRVPITSIVPAADFDGDDDAMMAVNNTSGFNCRAVVGGTGWSRHAFGRAIDINPLVNPYVRGTTVLPPAGRLWTDRTRYEPGMLYGGGSVVELVRALGWRWGGDWQSLKDYQHIDTTG